MSQQRMATSLSRLGILLLVLLSGCSSSEFIAKDRIVVLALDTSGSAKEIHSILASKMRNTMEDCPPAARMLLFRFDSEPADFYDGVALTDGAEAGKKIKEELNRRSMESGTNLSKLFVAVKNILKGSDCLADIHIFTDCGIEEMTPKEVDTAREISSEWSALGYRVHFHGVRSGFRERIRSMVHGAEFH